MQKNSKNLRIFQTKNITKHRGKKIDARFFSSWKNWKILFFNLQFLCAKSWVFMWEKTLTMVNNAIAKHMFNITTHFFLQNASSIGSFFSHQNEIFILRSSPFGLGGGKPILLYPISRLKLYMQIYMQIYMQFNLYIVICANFCEKFYANLKVFV